MRAAKLSLLPLGLVGLLLLTCSSEAGRGTDVSELHAPNLRAIFVKPFAESNLETQPRTVARVAGVELPYGECGARWQGAIESEVKSCRIVLGSRAVFDRLKELRASPPSVLDALSALRGAVDSLWSALSNEQESSGAGPSADGVRRRIRLEDSTRSNCSERVPSELEALVEQRFRAELVGHDLIEGQSLGLRPSPTLRNTKQLLEAVFSLDVLRVPTVTHCDVDDSLNFEWDSAALDAVASTLESWRPEARSALLGSVPQGQAEAVRAIAEALPGAICGKLRRISCRELAAVRQRREAVPKGMMTALAARGRALSLKHALPALGRLHRAVSAWGCPYAEFGLDDVPRYAMALLDVATWQLTERTRTFVEGDASQLRELPVEPSLLRKSTDHPIASRRSAPRIERQVRDALRVRRQEIAAIAFVIAEPAIEALTIGKSSNDVAKSAWVDLFADLRGTNPANPLGESGLVAFEQLLGLLLAEPNTRCPNLVAPWASSVFSTHEGLFFQQGRWLLEGLAPHCVSVEGR